MGASAGDRPTFDEVFRRVTRLGTTTVSSSRGTVYRVTAEVSRDGVRTIVGRPASGQVRVHADCWGDDLTCQGTRAGGLYHGSPSLFDLLA